MSLLAALALMLGLAVIIVLGSPARAYYGRHSQEAMLTFHAQADIQAEGNALEQVKNQVQHLMGTFQSESFRKEFGYPGVLGENYKIHFTKTSEGSGPHRKRVDYDFKGTVVFQKEAFSHDIRTVPIKLPLSPDGIYKLGVVHGKNLCTDEHYNTEGDFWYFWDPDQRGCPLKGNDTDVLRLTGKLDSLPNSQVAYPQYDSLYGDNGNGDTFDIALFFGYIDDIEDFRHPHRRDDAAKALRFVEADLKDRGFELTGHLDSFREYVDGRRVQGINFLRHYEKRVRTDLGTDVLVRVQILLADTAIDSRDETFHRYLVPAFEKSDIVIYDGHSGLGGNLDLGSLPKVKFDPKKYQIFYFNGCSSYPYFNGMFFNAKGSNNLQIVLSGLPTLTETAGPNAAAFMDHFLDGRTLSYQKILTDLELSNGDDGTYLTGVTGEENSSWKP